MTQKKESISSFGVVIHDVQRMAGIANVMRKFGFGNIIRAVRSGLTVDTRSSQEILDQFKEQPSSMASRLRSAIEELGTTYIKFGQMLSTRYDLLPRDIIDELAKLQDSSPQMLFDTIEAILNQAYGDYHDIFESIEEKPLGSASIAQAHRATLKDGTKVVIKIQRPNLLPLIRSDIDILNLFARVLDNNIEEIAYFGLPDLIREFEQSIISELDFCHELENIEYFERKYGENPMFVFPTPFKELSRQNILVMREIEGQKITAVEANTENAHRMADAILDMAFDMVFREGVFHADPHPGNVFATPDNKIGLIDFGLVGKFTKSQRSEFTRIILAVHFGDCAVIARTLLSLGHPTKRVILCDLEAEISNILSRYYQASLKDIDIASFATDFISAGQKFAVQIPSEFTNAIRALINIEGIIQYLNPDFDIIKTLSQFSQKLLADSMKKEDLLTHLFQAGLNVAEIGHTVPSHLTQMVQDLEHDGLAIRLPESALSPASDAINGLATRLSVSFMLVGITIALILMNESSLILMTIALILDLLWVMVLLIWHFKGRTTKQKLSINPMLTRMKRRRQWFN